MGSLFDRLTEDSEKVHITHEDFKLLSGVLTEWRPDLMQKVGELLNEFQTISKSDPSCDARALELVKKYSDVIGEIAKEIQVRKDSDNRR